MSLQAYPIDELTAHATARFMKLARPDSEFEVVNTAGRKDLYYVRETHANGKVNMHGREQRRAGGARPTGRRGGRRS